MCISLYLKIVQVIRKFIANKQSKAYSGTEIRQQNQEEHEKVVGEGREHKTTHEEFWNRVGNIIDPAKIKVCSMREPKSQIEIELLGVEYIGAVITRVQSDTIRTI